MLEENEVQITPKEARQREVDSYKANIATYKALLLTLDGEWYTD